MDYNESIVETLAKAGAASPAGFAMALHVRFASPRYLFQSYPADWMEVYSKQGLVLKDPTVAWGFAHTGACRWSALAVEDAAGVLAQAAGYGLAFGVTVALDEGGSRSIASFSRGDREFSDAELAEVAALLARLHEQTAVVESLSPATHAALKRMSIILTHS